MDPYGKLAALKNLVSSCGSLAVAYSGGVDSTLLLAIAHEVLGEGCLAVIASSPVFPKREHGQALAMVEDRGIRHVVVASDMLHLRAFSENPPDRCYHCKKGLFSEIIREAGRSGIAVVADGTNADDVSDYRPGMKALHELGVRSPLRECGITKADIRLLSREVYGLATADRQSMACMASRIPYGSAVTAAKLAQIEAMEDFLAQQGFRFFRARHHGEVLRLELGPDEMVLAMKDGLRSGIVDLAKKAGFTYVTLDLQGFRSGSMDEALLQKDRP